MVQPFLKSVAEYIYKNHKDTLDKLCIVLPNKRGAIFLKKYLAQTYAKTIWLPNIISIEEFIAELSQVQVVEEIDLICLLFESYRTCYGANAEPFEDFAKWGQLILKDFNEIDRFLVNPEQLYENLKDIKEIENWSLGENNLSEYQTNYLKFMNSLGPIYKHFSSTLLSRNIAYQGLAYRKAVVDLLENEYFQKDTRFLFCGFNALNTAEIKIFQHLKNRKLLDIIWDADNYYLNDHNQEAGQFLRQNFSLFAEKESVLIENNFIHEKEIKILSVPKQIGQAQAVKQCLQDFIDQGIPMSSIAIVLANEKLLMPVLKQLPQDVQHVNITMEYPIQYTYSYELIEQLLNLQVNFSKQNRTNKTIYYKDLISLIGQPLFKTYADANGLRVNWNKILNQIHERNLVFITNKNFKELFEDAYACYEPLVKVYDNSIVLCELIQNTLKKLIEHFAFDNQSNQIALEHEYLYVLNLNFNRLNEIINLYPYFNSLLAFKQLFTQVIGSLSSPFVGEPLQGLQIMGVLETRTLDFENVIFVNVNEGVLPTTKSNGSFIPNDLKRVFGLPMHSDKDAIYAYHFYRLIQRANNIIITYDTETDTFGKGEKSRFVTQLQLELKKFNSKIVIQEYPVIDNSVFNQIDTNISILKNAETLKPILEKASSNSDYGSLSPSSLTVFKECSLKFYFKYAAKLKEHNTVEEVPEANTFGSILHKSLELIYQDQTNTQIFKEVLISKKRETETYVRQAYLSFFDNKDPIGKNILYEEVIKVYVDKVIQSDLQLVENLKQEKQFLKLLDLEREFSAPIAIKLNGQPTTIYIKGKIDRIDQSGDFYRIIDYKTSIKSSDKFTFNGFDVLFSDPDYNKQLQLIIYAWLLYKNNFCDLEKMQPCIIPLKVFSGQPLFIKLKREEALIITKQLIEEFEKALIVFIEGIFNVENTFCQTTETSICEYCEYNTICNKQV